jgi:hypothetical protein
MEDKEYFKWSNLNQEWIEVYYTWNDVAITKKVNQALGDPFFGLPHHPPVKIVKKALTKTEYRKFVGLVCRVNGITTNSMKERKPGCELTLIEIRRTIEEVLKPKVTVTSISNHDIIKSNI